MDWSSIVLGGYGAILAAILAFEFRGLSSKKDRWPTITEIVRHLMAKHLAFKIALGVLLAWLPLHFFFPGLGV